MRRWTVGFMVMVALACIVCGPAVSPAATEAEKQAAIDKGLQWLAATQVGDGRWNYGDDTYDLAASGAALLAFLGEGYSAGNDVVIGGTNYGDVVGKGMNFLLNNARPYNIYGEPTGNPDADGNGIGVKFSYTSNNDTRDTYVTGLVLPAIASSGTPSKVVTAGPLAARTDGSGPGGAWTYRDVVQNTVDYFAYGQADPGNNARGGWRYYADYGQSDNSTAQWAPIGMLFATQMGVTSPDFVKDELAYWVDYIQYRNTGHYLDGSSGYDYAWNMNNEAKTGGLLIEMFFAGDDKSLVPYDLSNPDVLAALGYLNREWLSGIQSTWDGNFGHPYAMWSVYKGLEATVGVDDTTYITNLHNQGSLRGGAGAPLDDGDQWTWWEDYCEWLVTSQYSGGNWGGFSYWTGPMATAWNVNILAATEIPPPEPVIPEPATVVIWGGLVGLVLAGGWWRRRKRAA